MTCSRLRRALNDPEAVVERDHRYRLAERYHECSDLSLYKAMPEMGMVWARRCAQKVGNRGVFLPELYRLYRVKNTDYNPFADLSVAGQGDGLRSKFIG